VDFWVFSAVVEPSSEEAVRRRSVRGDDDRRRETLLWDVWQGRLHLHTSFCHQSQSVSCVCYGDYIFQVSSWTSFKHDCTISPIHYNKHCVLLHGSSLTVSVTRYHWVPFFYGFTVQFSTAIPQLPRFFGTVFSDNDTQKRISVTLHCIWTQIAIFGLSSVVHC